jgi:sarcosine dehydrogenase
MAAWYPLLRHATRRCAITLRRRCGLLRAAAEGGGSTRGFSGAAATTAPSLPAEADAVIIGGGSIGTSTLYHLQKLGLNAVLIESQQLTSGTTWHSAGLLWQLAGMAGQMDTDIEFVQYTKRLVTEALPAECDEDWAGWVNQGAIFACSSRDRRISHNRVRMLASAMYGVEAHDVSPSEAKAIHPLMNVDDLHSAVHVPGDGTIDPSALVRAYARAAKRRGGKVFEGTRATAIHTQDGRVTGVSTTAGDIRTSKVINCGGVWGRKIASLAGVSCPLLAYKHAYVVTGPIEGLSGLPSIRDYDRAVYMKVAGDAFHIGGYERNPVRLQTSEGWEVEDDFAFGLFDLDYDVFGCHLEAHVHRVPAIEHAGIASTVNGPESFTPDHRPLMGESAELRGFYFGCGLNSAGILYSGGFGRELASWVATGRAKSDVFGFDINRFHPECVRSQKWLEERSHETYANQSIIPWAHDQPLAGRDVRTSPFHEELVQAGCVHVESHGFERPGWFEGARGASGSAASAFAVRPYDYLGAYETPPHATHPYHEAIQRVCSFEIHREWEAEHRACREAVAVFDTSAFGKLMVEGPDAAAAMEWLCSNTVAKPAGSTTYTALCNSDGTVEADLTVSALEGGSSFYLCTGGATATRDTSHIRRVIADGGYDAHVRDVSAEIGILSVQGPQSRELLQRLSTQQDDWSDDAFAFSTHRLVSIAGCADVRAVRITFMGELGWELHVPRQSCVAVHRALMDEGRALGIANAGYFATGSLSLEKGYRHWHSDLRVTDTPMAAGLGFTCKFKTDTPFLGREALEGICAEAHKGLNGRVACFTTGHLRDGEAAVPLHGMEPLYRDGVFAGFLRAAGFGFSLEASIGYAYILPPDGLHGEQMVSMDYLRSGSFEIDTFEHGRVAASFHAKAPFDPQGLRIRGDYLPT